MSTLVFVDPEIFTQDDGAQSPRVPVPFPKDPYEAIRQACLVETDFESEPFEDPVETETLESPHTVVSPTSLPDNTPPTRHAEESVDSDTSSARPTSLDFTAPLSLDHPLTYTSPTLVPFLCRTARMAGTYELVEDDEEEDEEVEESSYSDRDEGLTAGDEGPDMRVESLGLGGDEVVHEGQQRAAPVVDTAVGEPLRLGYGALRRWEIASREGQMPSVFKVGQGSGSVPKPERPKRVSTLRQPTLTTWIDLKDGRAYIGVPAYPPPTPPVQTPPSPEWSSGSLSVSPAPSIVPSPISSPMIPLTGGLIHDHTIRLGELSPALFERYDRDIGELFTRSGAVRDEIFSQRYLLRSLEHEQERVAVTFGAILRQVLALES
ncbi:hypothetical protein Tco_0246312 [Tanacetum coccineum]